MFSCSANFIEKALSPGREIGMEIHIGESPNAAVFGNGQIISAEWNDVIHPDVFTFGTAAANRFSFKVKTSADIPVSAAVRPYVFWKDLADEKCPLGVFYISKKLRKDGCVTVTCLDMMCRLDYVYTGVPG